MSEGISQGLVPDAIRSADEILTTLVKAVFEGNHQALSDLQEMAKTSTNTRIKLLAYKALLRHQELQHGVHK